jgi:hypothetical protein
VIELVPVHAVDHVWPLIADGMQEACRRSGDDLTPWFLLQACRRSDALLFVASAGDAVKAGLVCRPEQWGGKQVLRVLALTGWEMDAWLPALKSHRQWPAALDIKSVVFEGREGWKRLLPEARVVRSIYEVRIDGKA